MAIAYDENSNPTSTVDDVHVRVGNGKHLFDVVYTLDALNRVIGADEGNKSGSSIESGYHTRNELWNSLSLTGNWGNRKLDANGDGDFGDEEDRDEPLADQTFTKGVQVPRNYDQRATTGQRLTWQLGSAGGASA